MYQSGQAEFFPITSRAKAAPAGLERTIFIEIAQAAGVSLRTVRVHPHAISRTLGVENRLQAVKVFLGR